jgi:chorismate mutase
MRRKAGQKKLDGLIPIWLTIWRSKTKKAAEIYRRIKNMDSLKPFRTKIDALDDQIIDLLAARMDIVRAVGGVKSREGYALVQTARVQEVLDRCAAMGSTKSLDADFIRKLYTLIIDEAHRLERGIIERAP